MLYIAENLKRLRKERHMTQENVADALGISTQSVSKWEREESYPDITLLPALANLYQTSVDTILGMEQINDKCQRDCIFRKSHEQMAAGAYENACVMLRKACKAYPNDDGILSELAIASALSGSPEQLQEAAKLCCRILSGHRNQKVCHTARAALCFIYKKMEKDELAAEAAKELPHCRESREYICSVINKQLSGPEIDRYLRQIALGVDAL